MKKIKYILIAIITIFSIKILTDIENEEDKIYYKDYIINLKYEYDSDFSKLTEIVDNRLKSDNLSDYEKGLNLLARQTYLLFDGNFERFKDKFDETEHLLAKQKMYEELVFLYGLMNNIAKAEYEYEQSYLLIYKSELITKLLYNKTKDQEHLSTLLAIKYLKSNLALDIGLEDESEKAFLEAEELRKDYHGRKRSDIYGYIAEYYYNKGDYEKAKEYGLETIEINGDIKQYKFDSISMAILVAQAYIKLDEVDKALEIAKEIEPIDIGTNYILKDKLELYSDIYYYYGKKNEAINALAKAYKLAKEKNDFIEQDKILKKLIFILKQTGNEKDLLSCHEEHLVLHEKQSELKNNQFLISKIIDSEIINAKADLKIVELEKKNLVYIEFILLFLLSIIILFILRLVYLNRYDELTKVYNRRYFNKTYNKYNANKEYSLIIFDIDNFKNLNDTYGHDFGDIVLVNISKHIKNIIDQDCKLFRYGGEEFVILIKNKDIQESLKVGESVRELVESLTWKENIKVTISLGVSYSGDNFGQMLKVADTNLYKSKINGKNRLTYRSN